MQNGIIAIIFGSTDELTYIESVDEVVINNKECKKLNTFAIYVTCTSPTSCYYDTTLRSTDYYYRENHKLFHWDPISSSFETLYNFSLNPGDVEIVRDTTFDDCWQYFPFNYYCSTFEYIVDSVDQIIINDQVINVQYTSPTENANWLHCGFFGNHKSIENIGSTRFLMGASTQYGLEGDIKELRCYKDTNIFYRAESWPDNLPCGYLTPLIHSGKIENNLVNIVSIAPNPCSDIINISCPDYITIDEYEITNIGGHIVQSGNSCLQNCKLDIRKLKKGFYSLRLNIGGNIIAKKFVKL